jgi:ABC-type bacteriocin/lantibiotic exporter with double-glycine peptidase domain
MQGAIGAQCLYGLLRAAVRYLQSAARDRVECGLLRRKLERQVHAISEGRWDRLEALGRVPRDSLTRIAELLGNAPAQVIGGAVYLGFIILALYLMTGPITAVIVAIVFATKLLDLVVVSRQAPAISARAEAAAEWQTLESDVLAASRSIYGLRPAAITRSRTGAVFTMLLDRCFGLRRVQLLHDSYLNISLEMLFVLSFLVAGLRSFQGALSFGQFVFVVTLLLQLHLPVGMLLDSGLELFRLRAIIRLVRRELFEAESAFAEPPPFRAPALPPPLPPFRVGVGGASGSGKTTLIAAWYRHWLKSGLSLDDIAVVAQQVELFPSSVSAYLDPQAPTARTLGLRVEGRAAEVLSGGERRRLLIARALILEPRILVLDEPEAGLDESARADLLELLRREIAARELSVLIVSHDPRFLELGSRVYTLGEGQVVAEREVHAAHR